MWPLCNSRTLTTKRSVERTAWCAAEAWIHVGATWCRLAKKPKAEKKLAITVFSFPPDKGNVGTAAYLNVFGSIYRVLQDLKSEGYDVGEVPETEEGLMQSVRLRQSSMAVHIDYVNLRM